MTTLRGILVTAFAVIAASAVASAAPVCVPSCTVGYETTIGPMPTDLTNFLNQVLPSFDPGSSNTMGSNVSGSSPDGSYLIGVSMNSLVTPGFTYVLTGFNVSVDETLKGQYTVTNVSAGTVSGSAHVDTYTAVALGSPLTPPLDNSGDVDPTNDLYNCTITDVGAVSATCSGDASGEQSTSPGGGPDPNSPQSSHFNLTPGQKFTSTAFNVTSGFVDYGCEVNGNIASTPAFCSDGGPSNINDAASNELGSSTGLFGEVITGNPNLNVYLSTSTETTTTVGGGNLSSQYVTNATENVEVTYTFTEIPNPATPEPASLALTGIALVGIGLARKRLKKS